MSAPFQLPFVPSGGPGTQAPCRCWFPLGAALEIPDGTVSVDLRNPEWVGYGRVGLRLGPATACELRYCPVCGGRIGPYTAADRDAWLTFRAGREAYDGVQDERTFERVRAFATARGAAEVASSEYSVTLRDAARHLDLEAAWDPDHERVYTTSVFYRG